MGRKRKSGEGTIRLRKDGRWEGRVVIGYDEKGLPKTKNVLAKTKGECVENQRRVRGEIEGSEGNHSTVHPLQGQGGYALRGMAGSLVRNLLQANDSPQDTENLRGISPAIHQTKVRQHPVE